MEKYLFVFKVMTRRRYEVLLVEDYTYANSEEAEEIYRKLKVDCTYSFCTFLINVEEYLGFLPEISSFDYAELITEFAKRLDVERSQINAVLI